MTLKKSIKVTASAVKVVYCMLGTGCIYTQVNDGAKSNDMAWQIKKDGTWVHSSIISIFVQLSLDTRTNVHGPRQTVKKCHMHMLYKG